jgi:hypothetical protein
MDGVQHVALPALDAADYLVLLRLLGQGHGVVIIFTIITLSGYIAGVSDCSARVLVQDGLCVRFAGLQRPQASSKVEDWRLTHGVSIQSRAVAVKTPVQPFLAAAGLVTPIGMLAAHLLLAAKQGCEKGGAVAGVDL